MLSRISVFLLLAGSFASLASQAQSPAKQDTAITFSITIVRSKNIVKDDFPNVYPDIDKLVLTAAQDTVACTYAFPFLTMRKKDFYNIIGKDLFLTFYYNEVNKTSTARYLISFPLRIPFTYTGAKFVVLKRDERENFLVLQKWGSTISTAAKANVKRIY